MAFWGYSICLLISTTATRQPFRDVPPLNFHHLWGSKKVKSYMTTAGILTCLHGIQKHAFLLAHLKAVQLIFGMLIKELCQPPTDLTTSKINNFFFWIDLSLILFVLFFFIWIESVDEVEAANSLCISPDGEKLYCGFDKCVRVFDVQVPGRNCQIRLTKSENTWVRLNESFWCIGRNVIMFILISTLTSVWRIIS